MEKQRTFNAEHQTSNASAERTFDLEDRLLQFASVVIDISEALPNTRAANHVAGQFLRSGTSSYAIHGEAESAESAEDFVHKMKLCLKELRETRRWFRLVHRKTWLRDDPQLNWAMGEADELIRIFFASIRTAQGNKLQRGRDRRSYAARC